MNKVKSIPTITLFKTDYDSLINYLRLLNALKVCGVENWEGYERAVRMSEKDRGYFE